MINNLSKSNNYDSGWFAVSIATLYTKSHGLGVFPRNIQVLFSDTADGSGDVIDVTFGTQITGDRNLHLVDADSSSIMIRCATSVADYYDKTGTRKYPASGYARITAEE